MSCRLRVSVDEELCVGSRQCELYCPQVFEVRDEVSQVKLPEPPEFLHDAVYDAADTCPARAIQVQEG